MLHDRQAQHCAEANAHAKMSLESLKVSSASILIYYENKDYTFYLTNNDLLDVVEAAGGVGHKNIKATTNLCVLGDTSREFTRKGKDKWLGSGRQKLIAKHQTFGRVGGEATREPLKTLAFADFVHTYGLEDEIEPLLLTAKFEDLGRMEMRYVAPGKARTVGKIDYYTLSTGRDFHGLVHWGCVGGGFNPGGDGVKVAGLFKQLYNEAGTAAVTVD